VVSEGSDNSGRDERGRFAKGNPGGPGGAHRRPSELRRAAEEAISPDHVAAMVRKATKMGLEGNLGAMRLVFDRTVGRATEAPVDAEPLGISIPRLCTAGDCNAAIELLIDGICRGSVDRDTAKLLIDAVNARIKVIEVRELDERLTELEQSTKPPAGGRGR
jgi:hypothetical protein